MRLIGADGSQLGIMETRRALEMAIQQGLDLAEISPNSNPPVCKILDYGKYKYEAKKKAQKAKKNQAVTTLKEIQFRPNTDTHDIEFKVKHIQRFLEEGNKVRVAVKFRGREASHADLGHNLLKQIIDMVGNLGIVEQAPKMEGKVLSLVYGPTGKVPKKTSKPSAHTSSDGKAPEGKAKSAESAVKTDS